MNGALATWIDGERGHAIPAGDRGLQYGDGLFETILLRGRRPRFLALHLERLLHGCARLHIGASFEHALRAEIDAAADLAPPLAILKLIVTRGDGLRRGYAPDGGEMPRRIVSLFDCEALAGMAEGVDLGVSTVFAADQPALAGLKHLNRLENILAAREARMAGLFESLMLGQDGRIVSGAMSNFFMVSGNTVLTPPVDRAGVAGVMRAVVLRECASLGLDPEQRRLEPADLRQAEEAFITNARIGVVPVRRVGEHVFRMNTVTRRLASHLDMLDA
jgi:4-amino-4-deoxychorismate lyase